MSLDPPTTVVPARKVVTVRALVIAVLVASLLSTGAAVALSYALIGQPEPGPRGPEGVQGPSGERGSRGPAGHAEVDEDAVWEVVESDPQRVTDLVEDNLDPSPTDVQTNVEDVASNLSSLCSDLSLTNALSNEVLPCP
jgi:hypothetical protein